MTKKMPFVPLGQRSDKGPGGDKEIQKDEKAPKEINGTHDDAIYQNTHNQGYQQDR